jgi:hypothetical protein
LAWFWAPQGGAHWGTGFRVPLVPDDLGQALAGSEGEPDGALPGGGSEFDWGAESQGADDGGAAVAVLALGGALALAGFVTGGQGGGGGQVSPS